MKNVWLKRVALALLGAGGGFAYYLFVGCTSGTCPITSNPYISTAYGALIGIVFTMNTARKDGR
jgi:hypothetical protein